MNRNDPPSRFPGIATGLRSAWGAGYGVADLRKDVLAGLTVGTVAVPLSMALAIATGVPPQHGLYTAIVAGALIALSGGSRFNVSGPTAAFVVILFPIVQQYGLGGLLLASMMAGLILVALGLARMGNLIQFVPYPVTLGFTAGIGVVIATLQVPDFLGLKTSRLDQHFLDNLVLITQALPGIDPWELSIGGLTLAVLLLWPRLGLALPGPLAGLMAGALAGYLLNWFGAEHGIDVATIASRFSWQSEGSSGVGIPPLPPTLTLPWRLPGADGSPLGIDFQLVRRLIGPAFAIAVLGAIESLLCAVVSDGLTHTRHDPNAELLGQGIGNLVTPLFGGITATAALARTATSIRSGARSPIAAVVHSLVVLLAMVGLAPLLGMVPMAALAALLFVVAWNMAEARHVLHTVRSAPAGDVAILLTCLSLTVIFDMVLAVAVGIALASALFIRRMARMTRVDRIDDETDHNGESLPPEVAVYDINGPLFFGAAERALTSLRLVDPGVRTIILDLRDVPSIDGTAMVALRSLIDEMNQRGVALILAGLPANMMVALRRAGIRRTAGKLACCGGLTRARVIARHWHEVRPT